MGRRICKHGRRVIDAGGGRWAVGAFNRHAAVLVGDDDVVGGDVDAVIDQDHVIGPQVILVENGLDRGLGVSGVEAGVVDVGVTASGGGDVAGEDGVIVDVIEMCRGRD